MSLQVLCDFLIIIGFWRTQSFQYRISQLHNINFFHLTITRSINSWKLKSTGNTLSLRSRCLKDKMGIFKWDKVIFDPIESMQQPTLYNLGPRRSTLKGRSAS